MVGPVGEVVQAATVTEKMAATRRRFTMGMFLLRGRIVAPDSALFSS